MSCLTTAAPFPATLSRLGNGLTLIHQQVPATPVVVADVWIRAGASMEPPEWAGMAHFLEHMIFKGTDRLAPGVFDQTIEHRGGVSNAATSHDYAHFFITTATPYLAEIFSQFAELLTHATIPDVEFWRERDVVFEEIRQAYDNPDWLGFQALLESIYVEHPYGRSVLGTEATLLARSPAEMRDFYRTYYQPENITITLVGDIDPEPATELIETHFQTFLPCNDRLHPPCSVITPLTEIRRQTLELPRLEQARLMLAWLGPGVEQLPDAYALDLLSVLLAEGRTSRLVRQLREERGLVEAVSSHFSLQQDSSLFTITAWLEPRYLDRVEALIVDQVSELAAHSMSEVELRRCQRLLCNDYAFSTETPAQLAGLYGYYNTIADAAIATTYPEVIKALQAEELCQIASRYLSPYHYAATILKPG